MLERLRGQGVQVNTENQGHPQHQQSNNDQSGPSLIPNVQPQHQQSNNNQSSPSLIPIVQLQQNVSMTNSHPMMTHLTMMKCLTLP